MKYFKQIAVLGLLIVLISCAAKRPKKTFKFFNSGTLDVKLESYEGCSTRKELPYLLYYPVEQQNVDVTKFDKNTGEIKKVSGTRYDEYEAIGISRKKNCYISTEFDIKGNIVYQENDNKIIIGENGEEESQLTLSFDKNLLAYLSERHSKYLNIYNLKDKKMVYRKNIKANSISLFDQNNVLYIVKNKIFKLNFYNNTIKILYESESLKYQIEYSNKENEIFYISIPFDTNKNGKLDVNDIKFITRLKNNKEIYLEDVENTKKFGYDDKYIYYIEDKKLKYQLLNFSIPDFSSGNHYFEYFKKSDSLSTKLIIYNYLYKNIDLYKNYELLIYSNYLKFLKNNGFLLKMNSIIENILSNYPQKSKIHYLAELFKNRIYKNNEFIDLYNEYKADFLFEQKKYKELNNFCKTINISHLNKNKINKIIYYRIKANYEIRKYKSAKNLIMKITGENLNYNMWIEKAINVYIKILKVQNNYNQSHLKNLRNNKKNNKFIYTYLSMKIADILKNKKNSSFAINKLKDAYKKLEGKKESQNKIATKLSKIYVFSNNYIKGISFVINYLQKESYPVKRNYFLSYIKTNGLYLADKFYKEGDLLRTKKWLKIILNYLPNNIEANRELIKVSFELGNIDKIAGLYKKKYLQNKDDSYLSYFFGYAITYLGTQYGYKNNLKMEKAAYRDSLTYINEAIKKKPEESYFYLTKGWVLEQLHRFEEKDSLDKSLSFYKKGLALTESQKVKNYYYRNIGNIYYKLKLYERAFRYLKNLKVEKIQWQSFQEKISYLVKLSDLYYQLNYFKKAIEVDKKILNYYKSNQNYNGVVSMNNHIGLMYNQLKKYLKAATVFEKNLKYINSFKIDYDIIKIYRNIAYNSLQAEDDIRAIEISKKGLETLKDRRKKEIKKGFLDISLIIALKKNTSRAYKGFTPDMERNIFYSILATAYGRLGKWKKHIDYYTKKLKISDNQYANFIITNNLYNIYFELDHRKKMNKYLNESYKITKKFDLKRGILVNKLVKLYLKKDINREDINNLLSMEEEIKKINDDDLSVLYKILFNYLAEKFLGNDVKLDSLSSSMERIELEIKIIKLINTNIEFLEKNLSKKDDLKYLKRNSYLFEYKYLGINTSDKLKKLLGENTFFNLLILNDLVNINIYKGNYEKSRNYFKELINNMNKIGHSDYKKLSMFYRYNKERLYKNIIALVQNGYKENILSFINSIENVENYIRYERFNPKIISEIDNIYLNNYFYELEFNNFNKANDYLNKIGLNTKFFIGKMKLSDDSIYQMIDNNEKIAYKILDKYLVISRNSMKIDNTVSGANYIIDEDGEMFSPGSKNYFTINQLYLSYKNRFPAQEYETGTLQDITGLEKSFLKLNNVIINDNKNLNPYEIKINSFKLTELINEEITPIGLWINTKSEKLDGKNYKKLVDVLFYLNISEVRINQLTFGYEDLTQKEMKNFIADKKDYYNAVAYQYFKNENFRKAFIEIKKLVYLLKRQNGQKEDLIEKLILLINIGANYLNNPELIEPYLKEYVELKGLKQIEYFRKLAKLYEKNGFYSKAIDIYKIIDKKYNESNEYRLGILYQKMGNMDKSLHYLNQVKSDRARLEKSKILYKYKNKYDRALEILDNIRSEKFKKDIKLIKSFIFLKKGEKDKSYKIIDGLKESQKVKDIDSLTVNILIGEAQIYYENNDYLDSIKSIKNVLARIPKEKFMEEKTILGNLMGLNYMKLQNYESALDIVSEFISFAKKNGIITQLPYLKLNKYLVMIKMGEYEKALEKLNALKNKLNDKNNLFILNTIYKNIGVAYYKLNDYVNAKTNFRKIVSNSNLIKGKNSAIAFKYLFKITGKQKYLNNSLTIAEKHNDKNELIDIYYLKGKNNDTKYLKKSLLILKEILNKSVLRETRTNLFNKYKKIYVELLNLYLKKGQNYKYVNTIEDYKYLKNKINYYSYYKLSNLGYKKINKLEKTKKKFYSDISDKLKNDLKIKYQKDFVEMYIAHNYKHLEIDFNYDFSVNTNLLDNVSYLNYIVIDDIIYCGFFSDKMISIKKISIGNNDLRKKINMLRKQITQKENLRKIKNTAEKIYSTLIIDIDESNSELIISADGFLNSLPFDVLFDGDNFLIDKYSISSMPGIYYYKKVKNKKLKDNHILAVGNPDLKNEDLELYFAQKESNEIGFLFDNVDVVTGKSATETKVKRLINTKKYSIIHLATHSNFKKTFSEEKIESYLMLGPSNDDDGKLVENEINRLKINTNLVVLSACETGLSYSGNKLAIDYSFLNNNVGLIISTLWRISDVHTGFLFKNFYRNLYKGDEVKDSLYSAKIEVKNRFKHPVYWAGIKFIGL